MALQLNTNFLGRSSSRVRKDTPFTEEAWACTDIYQSKQRPFPPTRYHHAWRERRQLLRILAKAMASNRQNNQLVSMPKSLLCVYCSAQYFIPITVYALKLLLLHKLFS